MKEKKGKRGGALVAIGAELTAFASVLLVLRLLPVTAFHDATLSSTAFYDEQGRLLRLTLASDEKYRLWTPLEKISPALILATLRYEDRHFYVHPGFNPVSLIRSGFETYIRRGRRMGGSTITMQLARIYFRLSTNSMIGKIEQILCALYLESRHSKDDILEAYLNLAPYGGNIEGVGAASILTFGKSAGALSLNEAAALAVIPQNPIARADRGSKRSEHLRFLAPHFTDELLGSDNRMGGEVITTIDLELQRLLERQTKEYIDEKRAYGIDNAVALLLDASTMEIKAMVGSADYFDDGIAGQVNGARAKRSPGSTLKPFIYALGIDQGLIHPLSLLKDTPASFGAYSPDNFDGQFSGPITAEEALIKSRNIPAVVIASKLSGPSFYQFLKNAGISRLQPESFYGLSLVLGSVELSMEELVRLYAALVNGGRLKPLRYLKKSGEDTGVQIFSEEAAFVTLDMLTRNRRPGAPAFLVSAEHEEPVAWKTGTSYGFRDAWSVGIFDRYVLAVWIGRFDGMGNPIFVGGKAAAPLFFRMVDAVRAVRGSIREARPVPPRLRRVEVCAVSGEMPGSFCSKKRSTWFVPGTSPILTCHVHREILIDSQTGLRSCTPDRGSFKKEVYEFWPSDILKVFQWAGLPRRTPPPFGPGCAGTAEASIGRPPQIISPRSGLVYALRMSEPQKDRVISLEAATDADAHRIYWFANDEFIGAVESGRTFDWEPAPGTFVLEAIDDLGRVDSRRIHVSMTE
jgi:penicillin-binding protein 1C